MKDTMCGLVKEVNAPSGLVYQTDLPIPEINDDEVLIKVHCSAICGTDLHIMEWDERSQKRIKAPVTVGHETAGEIVAVGKNVTERKVGDRVSCESHIPCGECYFCKNGMPHICKNVKLFGCTQNGAFAEYAKIRWDCTFLLEDDVTDEAACMFEPMGAGIHGVEAAEVNGKTVLVSGCGPIGLTAISASKTFGAVKVIACDLIDEKLEVAKKMGADAVLNSAKCGGGQDSDRRRGRGRGHRHHRRGARPQQRPQVPAGCGPSGVRGTAHQAHHLPRHDRRPGLSGGPADRRLRTEDLGDLGGLRQGHEGTLFQAGSGHRWPLPHEGL